MTIKIAVQTTSIICLGKTYILNNLSFGRSVRFFKRKIPTSRGERNLGG